MVVLLTGALITHRRALDSTKEMAPALLALAITLAYLAIALTSWALSTLAAAVRPSGALYDGLFAAAGLAELAEQSGDEVDRAGDDDHAEHVRQDGMGEHAAPDLGVAQRGVGYLVGHADREGDIGEVAVAGRLLPVFGAERDAARLDRKCWSA